VKKKKRETPKRLKEGETCSAVGKDDRMRLRKGSYEKEKEGSRKRKNQRGKEEAEKQKETRRGIFCSINKSLRGHRKYAILEVRFTKKSEEKT